jgi:hypothetical protein
MKTLLVLLALSAPAFAQAPPKQDADGYEKVDGSMTAPGESIPAANLVAGAYGFIFAAVTVYAASIAARSRRVEEEMDELKRKLEKK